MLVIPALRQEDEECEVILGYIASLKPPWTISDPVLETNKNRRFLPIYRNLSRHREGERLCFSYMTIICLAEYILIASKV